MQRLIQGKFLRPQPGSDYLERPRLCEKLSEGLCGGLTLISAPAGYGKSTLVSTWAQHCPLPCAWLALDANDDDLTTFLRYLIGAIRQIYPDACVDTFALLNARQETPAAFLRNALIADLADLPEQWVLVLDDYHVIGTETIHQLLTDLLHYCPGRPHLLIASRHNPPLPLARLRAAGSLNEIRLSELRFTDAEIADYLTRALPLALAPEAVALLAERTEGWPAGLRLAILALSGKTDYAGFLTTLSGTGRFIMEYLVEEVLAGQPPVVQTFLQQTALLDRLCAPLCDALMAADGQDPAGSRFASDAPANSSSQAMLEYLARHNLFVIPLDEEQHWYRYHHLFQDLLLHRLKTKTSAEQRATLHMAASHWLESHGMLRQAIDQALATRNPDHVVRLIARQRASLLNQTRWRQIEQCLKYVPHDRRRHDPELLMLETWGLYHRGHWDMLPAALSQVAAALAQTTLDPAVERSLHGEMSTVASLIAFLAVDVPATIAHGRQALEDTAQELWIVRVLARLCLAVGLQMDGSLEQAYAIMQAGLSEESMRQPVLRAILFHCTCFIDWMAADLHSMERRARLCINLIEDQRPAGILGFGHLHLGAVRYHHNDLPAAEAQFAPIVRQPYLHYGEDYAYCACGLALTYQAQGRGDEARAVSEAAIQQMIETGNSFLLPVVQAFAAELALYQGDLTAASTWAADHAQNVRQLPMVRFYEPQLTPVKIWLAQATTESLQQAASLLDRLAVFVEATHNTRFSIEVLALQALLDAARGQEATALQQLEQAVRLAQPGGFLRLFVDLGSAIADLLYRLRLGEPHIQAYVQQIIAAFNLPPVDDTVAGVDDSTGIDALTSRERDVLDCFVERLTDKEIADRLVVSPHTVRSHSKNIFAKLGVHNRREAVQRAMEMGLLLTDVYPLGREARQL